MSLNRYDTMIDAIADLRSNGYLYSFAFREGMMKCLETGKFYQANEILIIEYHRFEGMSNPGDSSVIFAVECTDGVFGTIVSSYGVYADPKLLNFLNKVKIKNRNKGANRLSV
jgi:hypothetical protein